ncbi:hypothetical protein A3L11_07090 [Thermococcus siculi]|uniref:DUF996 domain-containing protein n=1 Tax=Thermococcus siculi TaxID=72803 RepID=A0A2Z2MQN4_9EURY|nr:hypothetical protein A3L11_07090 [Thermococcus siculi]
MGVNVRSEKNLGMWGSILALLGGFVPYIGSVLALVGLVLVLVALHGIGKAVGDDRPFKNYLYALIAAIAMVIVIIAVVFTAFLSMTPLTETSFHVEEVHTIEPGETVITHEVGGGPSLLVGSIALVFLLVIAVVIISAYFEMRAWNAMYEITGTKEFRDAANWFKWGAITAILIVGLLLIFIARIFVILGFSNMPEELEERGPTEVPIDSPIV